MVKNKLKVLKETTIKKKFLKVKKEMKHKVTKKVIMIINQEIEEEIDKEVFKGIIIKKIVINQEEAEKIKTMNSNLNIKVKIMVMAQLKISTKKEIYNNLIHIKHLMKEEKKFNFLIKDVKRRKNGNLIIFLKMITKPN